MEQLLKTLIEYFISKGMEPQTANLWSSLCMCGLSFAIASLVYVILKYVFNSIIEKFKKASLIILLREDFVSWCWWLIFVCILRSLVPKSLEPFPVVQNWTQTIANILVIGLATKVVVELVKGAFLVIFDKDRVEEEAVKLRLAEDEDEEYQYVPSHSLKGLQQMICIVIVAVGCILMLSALFGKNPLLIVSGIGAGAAVLMLVFKDSILGVVAGIQLTANDMLRPGDWITASKYGANGRVQEVTLATVKVLNWDHTIVTIPPYNLISGSFQNWRRMEESAGRRVIRCFNIDLSSIRHLSEEEKMTWRSEPWASQIDWQRDVPNITLLRRYLEHYLTQQPTLRQSMLYMVRELQPTPQGLPIEVYFFTSRTSWAAFEQVQAEVADHTLCMIPKFGLKVFQSPSGADLQALALSSAPH